MCVGDRDVNMEFGIGDADNRRVDVLICVQFIATNYHSDTVDFRLVGTHGANKVSVGALRPAGTWCGLMKISAISAVMYRQCSRMYC